MNLLFGCLKRWQRGIMESSYSSRLSLAAQVIVRQEISGDDVLRWIAAGCQTGTSSTPIGLGIDTPNPTMKGRQ